jgi:hypothetical protein
MPRVGSGALDAMWSPWDVNRPPHPQGGTPPPFSTMGDPTPMVCPGWGESGTPWYGVRQHTHCILVRLLFHMEHYHLTPPIINAKRQEGRRRKPRQRRGAEGSGEESRIRSEAVREAMRAHRESQSKKKASKSRPIDKDLVLSKSHMRSARAHLQDPMNAGRPFKVTSTDQATAAITSAAAGVGYSTNFQLDQLPQFADYTALFDQYRFTKIVAHVMPRVNVHTLTVQSSAGTTTLSPISVTFDPDDSTTPAAATDVLQYPACRTYPGYKTFTYEFKPRAAIAAYGGAFTQFADFDGWCDCASDDVEWYAFKVWQYGDAVGQTTHAVWDIFYVIECEFRFVH